MSLQEEVETFIAAVAENLPASQEQLEAYRTAQGKDPMCAQVAKFCELGWPAKHNINTQLKPYWAAREHLTMYNGLLLCGNRIVVPECLRQETPWKVHQGHKGIQKCRMRVWGFIWWPGVSREVRQLVLQCPTCGKDRVPSREPMLLSELLSCPWQKVGTNLFELPGVAYSSCGLLLPVP